MVGDETEIDYLLVNIRNKKLISIYTSDVLHHGQALILPDVQAIFGVEVLDLAFHRIDLRYLTDRLLGNLALVGQLQFMELALGMRRTSVICSCALPTSCMWPLKSSTSKEPRHSSKNAFAFAPARLSQKSYTTGRIPAIVNADSGRS